MVALSVLVCVCSCANIVRYRFVFRLLWSPHILSELWGIPIGFHVDSTDKTTFNCPAPYCQDGMFGYYSSLNISTLSCCCTLSFTCQSEIPGVEENNFVLCIQSGACYCRCRVRSTNGHFNAFHHKVMESYFLY